MVFGRKKNASSLQAEFDDKITVQVDKAKSDYDNAKMTFQSVDPSQVNLRMISANHSLAKNKYLFLLSSARKRNAQGFLQSNIIKGNKK